MRRGGPQLRSSGFPAFSQPAMPAGMMYTFV